MNAKVPAACSCCDCTREIFRVDSAKMVRAHHRQGVRLVHKSGNHSTHQLCPKCIETFCPKDVPALWRRQCMLYGQQCKDAEHAKRFADDPPIGILGRFVR